MSRYSAYVLRRTGYWLLLAAAVLLLLAAGSSISQAQGAGIFRPGATKGEVPSSLRPTVARSRFVTVDLSPFSRPDDPAAARLQLNLFDDLSYTAVRERAYTTQSGNVTWLGRLEGVAGGQVVLVVGGGVMTGKIMTPSADYAVHFAGKGLHIVYRIEPNGFPAEHPAGYSEAALLAKEELKPDPQAGSWAGKQTLAKPANLPSAPAASVNIDLLIVWTQKAEDAAGGAAAINALADEAVALANTAYANSGMDLQLTLVHAEKVNYTEVNVYTDLDALADQDGVIDNVLSLRDQHSADMVSMIIDIPNTSCGLGRLLVPGLQYPDQSAFNVVQQACAADNLSLAHELGHNLGSLHDRSNTPAGSYGYYSYSYGYQDPVNLFSTIMAYSYGSGSAGTCPNILGICPRKPYFSNPNVLYNGHVTGKPVGDPNEAYNALSIANTGSLVAGWREAPVVDNGPFQDVPEGSTYFASVLCLTNSDILSGYQCGGAGEPCGTSGKPYFRPNSNISRGQIAKVVSNSANYTEDPSGQMFQDVGADSPFFAWINRLSNRGHMSGYQCGGAGEPCVAPGNLPYFRPNAPASRGQLSKIVSNAAGFNEAHSERSFEDVPTNGTFYLWIQRLSSRGYINGYQCGGAGEPCVGPTNRSYFRPSNNVTRGQASKIVANTFFPACVVPARP